MDRENTVRNFFLDQLNSYTRINLQLGGICDGLPPMRNTLESLCQQRLPLALLMLNETLALPKIAPICEGPSHPEATALSILGPKSGQSGEAHPLC